MSKTKLLISNNLYSREKSGNNQISAYQVMIKSIKHKEKHMQRPRCGNMHRGLDKHKEAKRKCSEVSEESNSMCLQD